MCMCLGVCMWVCICVLGSCELVIGRQRETERRRSGRDRKWGEIEVELRE